MRKLLLLIVLVLPFISKAQSDLFEIIEVPEDKDDFVSILNFSKRINSIDTKDLLKFDSILFYKEDTLKYKYHIYDLKFFQKNVALADSVIRAATDSVYNKELNSFDTYFTDIDGYRYLDNRKCLNKNGKYFKAEQFSEEGNVAVITNWLFDKNNNTVKETNEFIKDSSVYEMSYRRKQSVLTQRHAKIKSKRFKNEFITDYNSKGGIVKYSYSYTGYLNKSQENKFINISRDKNNLVQKVSGAIDNRPIVFNFFHFGNTIQITRQTVARVTNFKLVMF